MHEINETDLTHREKKYSVKFTDADETVRVIQSINSNGFKSFVVIVRSMTCDGDMTEQRIDISTENCTEPRECASAIVCALDKATDDYLELSKAVENV